MRCVAQCLGELHALGVCHGDCKPRNVVRMGERWVLCDMDSATLLGERIGAKTSTAYCPPELARLRLTGDWTGDLATQVASLRPEPEAEAQLPTAHPSFDVWSLGVLLFELCAGHTLFSQDISNDSLVEAADKTRRDATRLCTWPGSRRQTSALDLTLYLYRLVFYSNTNR